MGYFRLLLAVGVLLLHTRLLPESVGRSCVSAFFVLSGFLITLTLTSNYQGNPLSFYWNRFLRIYPLYWATALLICLMLPGYVVGRFEESQAAHGTSAPMIAVGSAVMWMNYSAMFNNPAWSLPYEVFFYLLAPVIVLRRWWTLAVYAGGAIIGLAAAGSLTTIAGEPFGLTSHGMQRVLGSILLFSLGAALCFLKQGVARYVVHLRLPAILILAGLFIATNTVTAFELSPELVLGLTIAATMLIILAENGCRDEHDLVAADLCYPIYMLHYPILLLIDREEFRIPVKQFAATLGLPWLAWVWQTTVTAILTVLACIAWLSVERRYIAPLRAGRSPSPPKSAPRVVDVQMPMSRAA